MDSAIASLLQSLTQPPPSPAVTPQAAPMPGPIPTPTAGPGDQFAPPPPPSITDRVKGLLGGFASHFDPRPQTPAGYDGLLSPQDLQNAQPSLVKSIIDYGQGNDPRADYQNNLNNVIQTKMLAMQIGQQQRILHARAMMPQLFPEGQNETRGQTQDRLGKMYAYLLANGDEEGMKDVGNTLRGLMSVPKTAQDLYTDKQGNYHYVPENGDVPSGYSLVQKGAQQKRDAYLMPDGTTQYFGPGDVIPAGAKIASLAERPMSDQYTFAIPPGGDKAVMVSKPVAAAGGYTQPVGGRGGMGLGAGGIGGLARQQAAIVGMNNADQEMRSFEGDVAAGKVNYNGFDYWKGMQAKMYDAKGIIDPAIHAQVFAQLQQQNPQLANYLIAAEQWALEDSNLSGRPSDFRTKLDSFISALGPNAGKARIAQVQSFRGTRLTALNKTKAAMDAIADQIARKSPGAAAPTPAAGGRTISVNGKTYTLPH